jgi:hypothetical protein
MAERSPSARTVDTGGSGYGWGAVPVHAAIAIARVIGDRLLSTKRRCVIVDAGPKLSRGRTDVDLMGTGGSRNCRLRLGIRS